MAKAESRTERQGEPSPPNVLFGNFSALSAKRVDECLSAQAALVKMFDAMNRQWLDRMQSEANLASDFAAKLRVARTFPDAMAICQEWTSRRLELMAEDGKHLLADAQKFIEAEGRLMSNGWPSVSGGSSS